MAKKKSAVTPVRVDPWDILMTRIVRYRDAAVDESWKGGGDPADVGIMEARLALAWSELTAHIEKMKRDWEPPP